ncbi:MAG: hypothetical protein EZS28_035458, partial [Streblomastix strix]
AIKHPFIIPALLIDGYISLFVSILFLLFISWLIGLFLMIFCIVWIVAVHIFGRIYRSHHKKFTVNSISRTIIYEEIPVQCGFCLYNEQEKQSADKADDIQDDDKQQQTHTGLEINPTEDAEDV